MSSQTDIKILDMHHINGDNQNKKGWKIRRSLCYGALLFVTIIVMHMLHLEVCVCGNLIDSFTQIISNAFISSIFKISILLLVPVKNIKQNLFYDLKYVLCDDFLINKKHQITPELI